MPLLDVGPSERTLLFFVLIGLFAYQGFRRGAVAEAAKFLLIILSIAVGQPSLAGDLAIKLVNVAYGVVHNMLGGVAAAGNPPNQAPVQPQLIHAENRGMALLLMMLLLIGLGYLISDKLQKSNPFLGLLIGSFNGLLLSFIFLPILPDAPPINLGAAGEVGSAAQMNPGAIANMGLRMLLAPVYLAIAQLGPWFIPLVIVAIVVLALSSMKSS